MNCVCCFEECSRCELYDHNNDLLICIRNRLSLAFNKLLADIPFLNDFAEERLTCSGFIAKYMRKEDMMETTKVYSMVYDNQERGNNGLGEFLGEFRNVKQIREDTYVDDFIGVNIDTGEVCMILTREVCGYGGGIEYEVIPIPELMERA